MSVTPVLRAHDIKKSYGATKVLHGISLDVEPGKILAIMGPSGSGKSTLLHGLAAIIGIDSGEVQLEGKRIDTLSDTKRSILRRTKFGFVFQFSQLVPELTAIDNVALPLLLNDIKKPEAYKRAEKWLTRVGLADQLLGMPGQLSGGQAQRVALARAMVIEPSVLFADEPTGSLDSIAAENIMELFTELSDEHGTTIVMVTHEPTIAAYADREVIVRDGRLLVPEFKR